MIPLALCSRDNYVPVWNFGSGYQYGYLNNIYLMAPDIVMNIKICTLDYPIVSVTNIFEIVNKNANK